MLVPVQYQRIITLAPEGVVSEVLLEEDLPTTSGLLSPKVVIFNTSDVLVTVTSLIFALDFGLTDNPDQTGEHEHTIGSAEWPLPYSGGAITVAVGVSQPVPVNRVSALMPPDQPTKPIKHLLNLRGPVDELEEKTIRLVFSGFVDHQSSVLNNFRTM